MTLTQKLHNLSTNGRNHALSLPEGDTKKAILEIFREIRYQVAMNLTDMSLEANVARNEVMEDVNHD